MSRRAIQSRSILFETTCSLHDFSQSATESLKEGTVDVYLGFHSYFDSNFVKNTSN